MSPTVASLADRPRPRPARSRPSLRAVCQRASAAAAVRTSIGRDAASRPHAAVVDASRRATASARRSRRDATRPPRPGCRPGTPSRQACRWILPLEVLGMLPARRARSRRPALVLGGHVAADRLEHLRRPPRRWRRSTSWTITSRCSAPSSTVNAAPQPAAAADGSLLDRRFDVLRVVVQRRG